MTRGGLRIAAHSSHESACRLPCGLAASGLKMGRTLLSVLALASVLLIEPSQASPPISTAESARNEFLKLLWPVFNASSSSAGRLYYQLATCDAEDRSIPYPRIQLRSAADGETGLTAVRHIFRANEHVAIAEDAPGIIRIRIGKVPDTILNTRLSTIRFSPLDQYNEVRAIAAIENAPETHDAMQRLKLHIPIIVFDYLLTQPAEGLAHLPSSMTNVTVDQALDTIARTFKGVVVYAYCSPPSTFEISPLQ